MCWWIKWRLVLLKQQSLYHLQSSLDIIVTSNRKYFLYYPLNSTSRVLPRYWLRCNTTVTTLNKETTLEVMLRISNVYLIQRWQLLPKAGTLIASQLMHQPNYRTFLPWLFPVWYFLRTFKGTQIFVLLQCLIYIHVYLNQQSTNLEKLRNLEQLVNYQTQAFDNRDTTLYCNLTSSENPLTITNWRPSCKKGVYRFFGRFSFFAGSS